MGKRYIVTEDSGCGGCGCGTILGLAILITFIGSILPYLIPIVIIGLIIFLIFYIPKYKENKKKATEENEINERERRLELEAKRMDLERRERQLKEKRENLEKQNNDEWVDY
ncbi:hypothetical protein AAFD74_001883 [Enterococcus faecalis]|uniref:hypothetical protein n=1 Tax=Enterococcus faecalis TaxID=1351 RepID=UPI0011DD6CE4|nr:hypothetical protein [Enterococcus faecalis]TXW51165.1 hypothetical protein D4M44_07705 [Enterococcus faecalis]